MTACKDSLNGKKAVSATLAGVLAVGMVPAAAFAATDAQAADTQDEQGIELQVYDKAADLSAGTVLAATGYQGVAYDDPANIQISTGDIANATFKITKAQTKEDKAVVDLSGATQTVTYAKAAKDGSLPSNPATISKPTAAGTYYALVAISNLKAPNDAYNGAVIPLKFTVVSDSLEGIAVYEVQTGDKADDLSDTTFTYSGDTQKIGFKIGDKALVKDTDYTVKYYAKGKSQEIAAEGLKDAGDYTAIVTGINKYATGAKTVSVDFTVEKFDLSKATIEVSGITATEDSANANIASVKGLNDTATNTLETTFVSGPKGSVVPSVTDKGTYTFTVSAPKTDGKDNPNITGTQNVSYDVSAHQDTGVTWKYGTDAMPTGNYYVDHSLTKATGEHDGHTWNKDDFDLTKVAATTAVEDYKTLATTVVVKDHKTNEVVDASSVKTAGTWDITWTIDAKACDYEYSGTQSLTVEVTEGKIASNADIVVKQDGKVTDAPTFTYDGNDALKKLDITVKAGDKVLTEGTDYKVKVEKGTVDQQGKFTAQKVVDAVVDNGTYQVTFTSDSYDFTEGNSFILTVNQIDATHLRVAGTVDKMKEDANKKLVKDFSFLPYTGEAIEPTIEYLTNADKAVKSDGTIDAEKAKWAKLPAELYTTTYKYVKGQNATAASGKTVSEIKEIGSYQISLTKVSKADEKNNWNLGDTIDKVTVSDAKFFQDVATTDWFYSEVNQAAELGYMNGYAGTKFFGPNDKITRGQVAVVLFNMAGGTLGAADFEYDNNGGYASFADVDGSQYYARAVAWAKAAGVVNGYGDGTFKPESPITREEFAVMLSNYAKVTGSFEAADGSVLAELPDASSVSDWAEEAVAWAVKGGYMGKNTNVLTPLANMTRAEAAAMVVRYAG